MKPVSLDTEQIIKWLKETDPSCLEELWNTADGIRRENVGDQVYLRGLIEISNYCVRKCGYCGLSSDHKGLERYRMSEEEITDCARQAVELGLGTVVLQSGEDYGLTTSMIARVIRWIKTNTSLAVTLSLGERKESSLRVWKDAGADRYLLRFETSDPDLYAMIHPSLPNSLSDRIGMLHLLRAIGYEVGSGVMVGIPGQSYESLAHDLLLFRELDLDMIGVGPYLSHPDTLLGRGEGPQPLAADQQVPNTELMTYKVVALTRILCPQSNIPSTTALATLNREQGRELGLMRGANILMPNLTPVQYRRLYEIYPQKVCIAESGETCYSNLANRIQSLGREIGTGPGGRIHTT